MSSLLYRVLGLLLLTGGWGCKEKPAVVFQTDFGLKDGAVSAMKGVSKQVDPALQLFDLTHEIPAYNIWEAAYRLEQTLPYWPKGTVFVSVVDPGVGTQRKSIVAETTSGHFIVTPDNGTLSFLARSVGIKRVRLINEAINRRQSSTDSYTFHGRDVYAFTAARLASGVIGFEELGPDYPVDSLVLIAYQLPERRQDTILGNIPVLDVQYGNLWTNIPDSLIKKAGWSKGDSLVLEVYHSDSLKHSGVYPLRNTFGEVPVGSGLLYYNSLMQISAAINEGNFASQFGLGSGPEWSVRLHKPSR